jgi:predicted transcriptional regulator
MTKVQEKLDVTPVALTDDLTAMTDYVRSPEGRGAIKRGLADIRHGRIIEGKDALSTELKRRAEARRV